MTRMQDTRWQILIHLKKSPGMTVDQLAEALGLSSMGVRQHLNILGRDNLVEYNWERLDRGRPRYVYKITEDADELFSRHYLETAIEMADIIKELHGTEGVETLFKNRMERRFKKYSEQMSSGNLIDMIEEITLIRGESGYLAEYEEMEDYFLLKEFNCPNSKLAYKYPQICKYELVLFQKLFDVEVERECNIREGSHFCGYRIKKH